MESNNFNWKLTGLIIGICVLILIVIIGFVGVNMDLYLPNVKNPNPDMSSVICEDLNEEQCLEYPGYCGLCNENLSSNYIICRPIKFCENISMPDFQTILPDAVITIEECEKMGGEVFNLLEETEYEGVLIGKINELSCDCACRVDNYYPCKTFFDGCNTCYINEAGDAACTEMACEELREAKCIEFY